MLFNSYQFICLYLPIVLCIYFLLAKYRYGKLATGFLVVASLYFYSAWNIKYLPLLLGSILFNYFMGCHIEKYRKKFLLVLGISVNLALLAYFKYTGFFFISMNKFLSLNLNVPEIILPLGISFFTFTQTAYLVDAYRGETKKYSLLSYSLFVTIFPHLIAGPILYHKDMIPQFSRLRNMIFNYRNFAIGMTIFVIGLFKKVVIADNLSPWVKIAFEHAYTLTFIEAWSGAVAYTMQLYFDFSGYSEMAIGLGLMLNFKLPINFNAPYKATSIIEFWRRWHMTLSEFLKNYLYIPLGGNRNGQFKKMMNLMITMLLGGLWHGAGWTFVIWGGLHGIYLVVNHMWRKYGRALPDSINWLITFTAVVIAWVFFRAAHVSDAVAMLKTMFDLSKVIRIDGTYYAWHLGNLSFGGTEMLISLLVLLVAVIIGKSIPCYMEENFKPNKKWAMGVALFFVASLLMMSGKVSEFLYFQF